MRIYKRGSMYWFELEFNRKQIRKSTKSRNRVVAGQIASAYHLALIKGEVGIIEKKPAPAFRDAMKSFLSWSSIEHQAHPSTAERYRYSSLALIEYFKSRPIDSITAEDADEYKQSRSRSKTKAGTLLRPATVNRELACLRAMFNHAIRGNRDLRNPISKQTGVKLLAEDNQQERVLTYTEEAKYLANARPTLADVAKLILETGMRPEEVFSLRATCVDIEQGQLRILRGKTAAARRRIELSPAAVRVIKRRMKEQHLTEKPGGYLFPCTRDVNRPLPGLQTAHRDALKDAGVPHFRLYDLRHTFATRAAEAGMDLVTLAAVLGHSRIQMVLRYAHPTQNHQAAAMSKVSEHKDVQREKERRKQEEDEGHSPVGLHLVKRSA